MKNKVLHTLMGASRAKPTNVSMRNQVFHIMMGGASSAEPTNVSMTNRVFVSWLEP
jgi:hypothetical protein